MLVRQEGYNWEELRVTLELCMMPDRTQRWLIKSLFMIDATQLPRVRRVSGDDDPRTQRSRATADRLWLLAVAVHSRRECLQ